ncbi:Metalloenzyme, LuxS/M16 peptidase-like protein [Lophiotrema nucula]|uniref:Metalloenzyme, LuxS/M16 peptidase-like protein n=1 Tax=Lophiotrema nucula TaxID=690887 RepID=A0A6A5Z5U8_9PLEO|nr:Metalloenzyme, LuxS/M16 peptidase-like protein [Lophiotrema nucula]
MPGSMHLALPCRSKPASGRATERASFRHAFELPTSFAQLSALSLLSLSVPALFAAVSHLLRCLDTAPTALVFSLLVIGPRLSEAAPLSPSWMIPRGAQRLGHFQRASSSATRASRLPRGHAWPGQRRLAALNQSAADAATHSSLARCIASSLYNPTTFRRPSALPFYATRRSFMSPGTQLASMSEPLGREAASSRQRIEDLERPALDDRSYRIITLPNQLEVLLIHDAKTDKASAALDVNVGSFSDAEDMPGIAHAVEHLLFMGTEKYPQENAYNQYLTSHSGNSNAYTAATSTNYYFELAANSTKPQEADATPSKEDAPLWGALDRFGQFFIAPLFLADTVDRELKAVDSENKKNLQIDTWRLHQLNKALSNPKHPYNHFSTGSFKTLHDEPLARGVKIRDEFMKFHSEHYSANRMKLVILGREDLDTLEGWAEEIFSQIPNKNLPRNRWDDVPVYTEKELLTQTFAKPVFEARSLQLTFAFRDEEQYYESHPSRYLSHLIGHEGPGSIFSLLKSKGWANGLSAGGSPLCPGSGLFVVNVKATEEGLKNYKEMTKIIFQYIAMIREQPPQEWVFDEMSNISQIEFKFRQNSPASRTTSGTASTMQKEYNRKYLLSGGVIRKFDKEAISESMAYLRPDNFKLDVVSQEFPGGWDQKEKWYGTEFKTEKIPEEFVAEIEQAFENKSRPKELHFPHKNEFIPTKFDVEKKEVDKPLKAPKLIRNDENVRTWWKKDDQFWVPKANLNIYLRTPLPSLTARLTAITSLYRDLVQDALNEYAYDADIAGLSYDFNHQSGGLGISIDGYNDKLAVLLEKVLLQIRDLKVKEDRFHIMQERLARAYRNWGFQQPFHQIGMYSRWLRTDRSILTDDLLKELDTVTAADVQAFFPALIAQSQIEILAHGNVYKEDALKLSDLVEKTLKVKSLPTAQLFSRRGLILPPGSNYVFERQLKDPANVNHCIEYGLNLGTGFNGTDPDRVLRAKALLLSQMTDEPAFDQLRTKEQLGYVVFSGATISSGWTGYRVLIQSERDCQYLDGRIEHFLTSFEKKLEEMTDEEFQSSIRAVQSKRAERLKNLGQEANRFWNHMSSDAYDFYLADEDIKHVGELTKQEMVEWYKHYISPSSPHRSKLSVHLVAQAKPKEPTATEQKNNATAVLTTILKEENITPDLEKLQTRIEAIPSDSANPGEAIADVIAAHLSEDLHLEKEVIEKVHDEAKAALGLAVVGPAGETPEVLTNGAAKQQEVVGSGSLPVKIEDPYAWKAGLQMSAAVMPVRPFEEYWEDSAKL